MKIIKNKLAKLVTSQLYVLNNIPMSALSLGIAGLIPFWGLAVLTIILDAPFKIFAVQAEIIYGAVILSFLGGMHWGFAAMNSRHVSWLSLGWGVTPTLIAWGALFLSPSLGLILLIIGFSAAGIIDFRVFATNRDNTWFGKLRTILSIGTITALVLALSFGNFF